MVVFVFAAPRLTASAIRDSKYVVAGAERRRERQEVEKRESEGAGGRYTKS